MPVICVDVTMSRTLITKTSWNSGAMHYHTFNRGDFWRKAWDRPAIGWAPYYLHENSCLAKVLLQARHIDCA